MHFANQCGHDSFIALSNQTNIDGLHRSLCHAIGTHFPNHEPSIYRCESPGSNRFKLIYSSARRTPERQLTLDFVDQLTPLMVEMPEPAMIIPLVHDHIIIGALHVHHLQLTSPRKNSLLLTLGQVYAGHLQLLQHCSHDGLTGLYNRQFLDQFMSRFCANLTSSPSVDRRGEEQRHSYFALFDIDHFKQVNDNFGHSAGDSVLLELAHLMESSFRDNDFLFRYGGEEFAMVLVSVQQSIGWQILERFRERIASHHFKEVGPLSISIGFTPFKKELQPRTILETADLALYRAKAMGRNRIELFDPDGHHSNPADLTRGA
jgi:diguanylate cyclase (GGDEF)-like protein